MKRRFARSPRGAHLVIFAGFLAVVIWELGFRSHSPELAQLGVNAGTIAIPALASLVTAYRVRADRRTASAWVGVGTALTFTTAGYIVEIVDKLTIGWTPYPSLADVFFLGCYPIFLIGVLRFPTRRQTGNERLRLWLDIVTISLCAASLVWDLILAPTISAAGSTSLADIVSDAYPTADLLIVFGLVRLLVRGALPAGRRAAQLLGAGMLATILGDLLFAWAELHSGTFEDTTTTVIYAAADSFFLAAAISQRSPAHATEPAESTEQQLVTVRGRGALVVPYVAPVLLVALLVHSQFNRSGFERAVLSCGAAVALVLVLVRQVTVQRDLSATLRLVTDKTEELRHQALHDGLTGLPNRALILDRVEGAMSRARRHSTALGVMFIDLDGFKRINDTYGHAIGDRLLCDVSARLATTLRDSDTIGRLGGDEFVILVESDSTDLGAEIIADRIRDALAEPFVLGEEPEVVVFARASIGIAVGLRSSPDELLRDADVALYAAKDAGKDRYVLFAHEMQTVVQERLQLEMDLRGAIGTDQLFLVYQPIIDLRTGAVTGTEALLRWHHPTRGLVMPDEFIPLAEETGLIVSIGRWVLDQACRQTAAWHAEGHALSVSVNVSSRQLDDDIDLVTAVAAALTDSGLTPASLTLEITESVLVRDTEASAHRLRMLKRLGVRIAIDDFGTGYSSIAYLQRFPVDALKIDRSFVSAIGTSAEADALVHTLVQLGSALGLETCPEGIENEAQLLALQHERCDSGQGYHFSKPMSPTDLADFLQSAPALCLGWGELATRTLAG